VPGSDILPNKRNAKVYEQMLKQYAACEDEAKYVP